MACNFVSEPLRFQVAFFQLWIISIPHFSTTAVRWPRSCKYLVCSRVRSNLRMEDLRARHVEKIPEGNMEPN